MNVQSLHGLHYYSISDSEWQVANFGLLHVDNDLFSLSPIVTWKSKEARYERYLELQQRSRDFCLNVAQAGIF